MIVADLLFHESPVCAMVDQGTLYGKRLFGVEQPVGLPLVRHLYNHCHSISWPNPKLTFRPLLSAFTIHSHSPLPTVAANRMG